MGLVIDTSAFVALERGTADPGLLDPEETVALPAIVLAELLRSRHFYSSPHSCDGQGFPCNSPVGSRMLPGRLPLRPSRSSQYLPMTDGRTPRPQFSEIDAWGLTHIGKVRKENQDHYFLGALVHGVTVDSASIGDESRNMLHAERLASLGIVADGVGSTAGGEEASRTAVQGLVTSVSHFFHDAEYRESEDPGIFSKLLHDAASDCHEKLLQKAETDSGQRRFATTLTLFLGLWPHAYLLQVGDSRCYIFRDGRLSQISRDQTLAQELVDAGVLTQTVAEKSRWANILSSAMGGDDAVPVVTRITRDWGDVVLLCSDGLTKHVSDERIAERLAGMSSARQVAEDLLEEALYAGGTDNITILVGRTLPLERRT